MLHCNRVSISSRLSDIGSETYRGHDLDLSGLHDVIISVTFDSPYAISQWWNRTSIANRFADARSQHMLTNSNTHTLKKTHANEQTDKHDRLQYLLADLVK